MVCHVVGRKFAYRFREENTEYNICTKEVGHKNVLEKITDTGDLHDLYCSQNVTRII
jgi:DTW domain-containing protein YfiP